MRLVLQISSLVNSFWDVMSAASQLPGSITVTYLTYLTYLTQLTPALARPAAFEFKQRGHRRIAMDSFDGLAQKRRYGQRGNLHAPNSRAKDCISCYQFVNT